MLFLANKMKTSCVILAAGNSERMGQMKPFLRFNSSFTFLEKILHVYQSTVINKIIVVVNDDVYQQLQQIKYSNLESCKFVINKNPEKGRFHSIKLGIKEAINDSLVFLQNVDNPFVDNKTLELLKSEICDAEYAIPVFEGNSGHPILLSAKVANAIIQNQKNNPNLRNVLKSFLRCEVKVNDPGILVNINTPEEYSQHFLTRTN